MDRTESQGSKGRHDRGKLVVVSGPSGVGKTTLVHGILEVSGFRRVVTCTTRPPREGEQDGRDYHFLTTEEFQERIDRGEFLEYAKVHGELYGTPKAEVESGLRRGETLLLNIDVQGAAKIRSTMEAEGEGDFALRDHVVTVFVLPPSVEELRRRLAGRGTDCGEAIEERLRVAEQEMEQQRYYDYRVVNDTVSDAIRQVIECVRGEPARPVERRS